MFAFECHVISLARTPQKLTAFIERNAITGLRFLPFQAIDGALLEPEACFANGLISRGARSYARGTLGVAASHRALWQRAVTARTPFLVFEDDVHCRHDILVQLERVVSRLSAWDILLLGYNTDAVLEFEVLPSGSFGGFFSQPYPTPDQVAEFVRIRNEVAVVPLKNAFGMCSYLLSPQGAERLLAGVFPLDNREITIPYNRSRYGTERFLCRTFDMNVNALYRQLAAYTVVPPLALSPNDRSSSTTLGSGLGS